MLRISSSKSCRNILEDLEPMDAAISFPRTDNDEILTGADVYIFDHPFQKWNSRHSEAAIIDICNSKRQSACQYGYPMIL